jgi:hypothetical protein
MKFATGLITTDFQNYPSPPFCGKNWQISYRIDRCHGVHAFDGNAVVRGREVLIIAANNAAAQAVLGLIHASMLLIWPDPLMADRFWRVENANEKPSEKPGEKKTLFQLSTQEIPQACLIAAKASFRTRFKYALHKLLLSTQIFSVDVRSLDPSEGLYHSLSMFPDDHVRFAYSIITAYSAIEELGLEIRASKESPARLADGQWNPVVKHELQSRLDLAGVELTETVPWFLRGTPTRIEKKRRPRSLGKQKWARCSVRDCKVNVVDAIAHASWLRSHVSSHRFSKHITSLSVYDVANVQHLARRLILERLGFWKRFNSR